MEGGGGGGGLPRHFSPGSAAEKTPTPRGHRRHASFDPNTDCFAHYSGLGEAGRRRVFAIR